MEVGAAQPDRLGRDENLTRPRPARLADVDDLHQPAAPRHRCAHASTRRVIESSPGWPCNHGALREPVFTETLQIALVVRDLEESLRTYVEEYGIGPWEIYEFNPENAEWCSACFRRSGRRVWIPWRRCGTSRCLRAGR